MPADDPVIEGAPEEAPALDFNTVRILDEDEVDVLLAGFRPLG